MLLAVLLHGTQTWSQRFEARLYGEQDGLSNLMVNALTQDREGNLWIATQNGIFRYNGSRFQEFGRKDGFARPTAYNLFLDRTGTVWAGTHSGLYWFDGRRFQEVQFDHKSLRIGMNSMLAATPSGELIVQASDQTLSVERAAGGQPWAAVFYKERHPGVALPADTNGIGVDSSGTLMMGCAEAICIVGEQPYTLGVARGVPPDFYVAFFVARSGQVWARGRKHIVTWRPGQQMVRDVSATFPAEAMSTVCRRFAEDSFGNILAPTTTGFATWDGSRWTFTDRSSNGPIHGATEILADREGSIWVGTEGSGLLQSRGYRRWENYGVEEGLQNPSIHTIARDAAGTMWFGNNQATNVLRPGAASATVSPLGLQPDAFSLMALAPSADGGMWAGTLLGHIYHVDAAGKVDVRAAMDAYIRSIGLGPDGTLYIASSAGLSKLVCSSPGKCAIVAFPGAWGSLYGLAVDQTTGVWAAGANGLLHLEGGTLHPVFVPARGNQRIAQNFTFVTVCRDGSLWLAGQDPGATHISVAGDRATVIESFQRPVIASDAVSFIGEDARGRLWIGTDHGVNVVEHGRVHPVTEQDGLIWNDTGLHSFLPLQDGSVWIGTSQGVSHLLDPEAVLSREPFAAAIDDVRYGESTLASVLRAPWSSAATLIRFTGLTFRDNQSLVYHYRLEGFDEETLITRSASVSYPQLPPGQYVFHVVAEDTVHGVMSSPAEIAFTLTPPWWRSRFFYALLLLAGAGLMTGLWRWSHRVLLAQQQKLQRLVAERTRELEVMATHDGLTGLLNRTAILEELRQELGNGNGKPLCVALVDLDHFKQINDTYGHHTGDAVLRETASRLSRAIRESDSVGRYGGEEFVVVFRQVDEESGIELAERIREQVCAAPVQHDGNDLWITCSIGVAVAGKAKLSLSDPLAEIVSQADQAMYKSKSSGRNKVSFLALRSA